MPTTPTIPNGRAYVAANLWTGTGSAQTISNADLGTTGFQPDFIWYKARSNAYNNALQDSIRGTSLVMISNNTSGDLTDTQDTTAFNTNGFNIGTSSSVNGSGVTYVGWQWKAGGTAVTNNNGNRTSQVSANTTSGFSVVTYTFVTSGTNTVGHGLGVAPAMIIMKDRTTGYNWDVYHQSVGYTNRLVLNDTSAAASGFWAAAPTSSVFSVTSTMGNNNDAIVAYCWAPIAGYSAFGSYTGNGSSDGPFVYLGFRPRYILVKKSSNTSNWQVLDSSRSPYNLAGEDLFPNLSDAEATIASGTNQVDFLSNGFKIRNTNCNDSGGTYIYACWAENPFKYANAR